jgi:hypothetical protein
MMSDIETRLRDYCAETYGGLKANAWRFNEEVEQDEAGSAGPSGTRSVDFDAAERGAMRRIENDRGHHRIFHRAFLRLTPRQKNTLERFAADIGGNMHRVGGLGSYHLVAVMLPSIQRRAELASISPAEALRDAVKGEGLAVIEKRAMAEVDAALKVLAELLQNERHGVRVERANRFTLAVCA